MRAGRLCLDSVVGLAGFGGVLVLVGLSALVRRGGLAAAARGVTV